MKTLRLAPLTLLLSLAFAVLPICAPAIPCFQLKVRPAIAESTNYFGWSGPAGDYIRWAHVFFHILGGHEVFDEKGHRFAFNRSQVVVQVLTFSGQPLRLMGSIQTDFILESSPDFIERKNHFNLEQADGVVMPILLNSVTAIYFVGQKKRVNGSKPQFFQ